MRDEGWTQERTWDAKELRTDEDDLRWVTEKGRALEEAGVASEDSMEVCPVLMVLAE